MFILTETFRCGGLNADIPVKLATVTSTLFLLVKIAIPIILIAYGMLDMGKAIVQQKEDDIKKAQQIFIKRIISAVLVFFIATIVQLVFGLVKDEDDTFMGCIDCFLSGSDSGNCSD